MGLELTLYIVIGSIVGVLSGLLGIGGGLIVVPTLLFVFGVLDIGSSHAMHLAIGTSLAVMVLTTLSSAAAHMRRGGLMWPVFLSMLPGIVLGASLGVLLAGFLSTAVLKILMGIFLLLLSLKWLFIKSQLTDRGVPRSLGLGCFGVAVGTNSALFGVGGSYLTVPFLMACNVPALRAIGTASMCAFSIAMVGSIGFVLIGLLQDFPISYSAGFVYLPAFFGLALSSVLFAPLGARLAYSLPVETLRRVFAVLLFFIGIWMLT